MSNPNYPNDPSLTDAEIDEQFFIEYGYYEDETDPFCLPAMAPEYDGWGL